MVVFRIDVGRYSEITRLSMDLGYGQAKSDFFQILRGIFEDISQRKAAEYAKGNGCDYEAVKRLAEQKELLDSIWEKVVAMRIDEEEAA